MSNPPIKTTGLTLKIIIGMVAGLAVGLLFNWLAPKGGLLGAATAEQLVTGETAGPALLNTEWIQVVLVEGVFFVVGQIFLASLKLLVVPLVFVSLVGGTAALEDITRLGRVGGKTMVLYVGTTALAITLGLAFAILIQPGAGFNLPTDATFQSKSAPPLTQTIINIFPTNPIDAMARGEMLQVIIFAILFGLALTLVGQKGQRIVQLFTDLNDVIMTMVLMMMLIAPYGVFCLVARVFATEGLTAIVPLAKYFFLVLAVLLIHGTIVYGSLVAVLGRLNPIQFFRKMRSVIVFAFSTASSSATLPVTLEASERKLGVDNSIAAFTIPLGATINMDGTAIMQGVATVFIAQAYGIDIGVTGYLMVILTATLASIGTAGVPGVGLITLAMVLQQVNLPEEGIGLIIGVDRLLDMVRTAVNVTGDVAVTCVVARSEGLLSMETFNAVDELPAPVSVDPAEKLG